MVNSRREDSTPPAPIFRARGWLLVEWSALLLAATILVGGLVCTGATTKLDNALYDVTLKLRHRPPPADIVIVGVDGSSMSKLGPWPWPRQTLATIIRNIARDGPRAIVVQFIVNARIDTSGDVALRDAIASGPVYLPAALADPKRGARSGLLEPLPEFATAAAGVGLSAATPDSDGIVRRALLYAPYEGGVLPDVAVLAAGRHAGAGGRPASPPPGKGLETLISFAGPPGHFDSESAADVLRGAPSPGRFKDRIVLVGPTAPGLFDNYPTPVSGAEGMPSVEIEANTVDAVLHHHAIQETSLAATLAVSMVLLWVTFFELLWLKPTQFALQPLGSLAILLGAAGALALSGVWFPPMAIAITRTIAQTIWSARRLQAASNYFAHELADLQIRSGGAILPTPRKGLPMGDSVTRQMVLIDETKRRVRELRRFVTDVIANFPDPVMVVTARGRVMMFNEAAIDLAHRLGRSAETGSLVQPILQDLAEAAGSRTSFWPPTSGGIAPRGVAPGGRILEARFTPTGAEEGEEIRGWTVHLADVTAQVSAMRQRDEALQLFTHDMRAPQSAILAALESEEMQSVSRETRERIAHNAMRTVALAEGFVRLAQAETPEYYRFAPIDFVHLLGDATDALWTVAQSASVEIAFEPPEREFVVDADRRLLSRAIINLLDNAIRFSPPGSRVICTLGETRLRDRPAMFCRIADQSEGKDGEEQRGLVDRCSRPQLLGDNDDALPDPGGRVRLGMGLSLTQAVVHHHDGLIDWRSDKGRGTVFSVTLPLCAEPESVGQENVGAEEPAALEGSSAAARGWSALPGPPIPMPT